MHLPDFPAGSLPMKLIWVEAGSFTMGAPAEDSPYPQLEWPAHSVTLTRGFYLGIHEVTQAQWKAVLGENPARNGGVGNDYPVYNVSWSDCQRFVRRIGEMTGQTFRLPTEAEWEYACRAGTSTRFSFGDGPSFEDEYRYYEEPSQFLWWFGNNEPDGVKPAGLKRANPWGFFDMHGNLYEWCSDWWEEPYPRLSCTDPQGPSFGTRHVVKGGHWYGSILHCRSAFRFSEEEAERRGGLYFGLRVVMDRPTRLADWELY